VRVIGVGNDLRGDDAAGLLVARKVAELQPDHEVHESSGDPALLMERLEGNAKTVLVDAVDSGGAPGEIHRLEAHAAPLPTDYFHCSTHAFGIAEAIELARNLDRLPPEVVVYGIEGRNFQAGQTMSPEVEAAIATVAQRILREAETGPSTE